MLHSIISIAKAIPEKYKLDLIGDVLIVYDNKNNLIDVHDVPDDWYVRGSILGVIDERNKPNEYTLEELMNV